MAIKELTSIRFPDLGDEYKVKVTQQVLNESLQALTEEVDDKIDTAKNEINNATGEALSTKADAIVKTASGEIASFTDGGDDLPMKSLKVNIVPKQSGSGDPSPDNVRPISGTDTVGVAVVGDNAMPNGTARTATFSGITYTSDGNGNYTIRGTSTGTDFVGITLADSFMIPSSTDYSCFFMNDEANEKVQIIFMYNSSIIDTWTMDRVNKSTTAYIGMANKLCNGIRLRVAGGTTVNMKLSPMLVPKSVSGETFIPYEGESKSISLGQTVYGGTLEVMSGKLVIDRGYATFDGSSDEAWSKWDGAFVFQGALANIKNLNTVSTTDLVVVADRFVSMGVNYRNYVIGKNAVVKVIGDNSYIAVDPTAYADVNAFKTSLASNPMQVVYELATPTEITLTPTQVKTLLGNNNIRSDSGTVEVEYRADTTLAYNELLSLIASLS